MPTVLPPHATHFHIYSGKFNYPVFLMLIIAGLAGNYLHFPIFLNIDYLFGSIFAMLALQFFGLGRGILAAAVISGYTYLLWNHPYAIIIMTSEVAVVGWLVERRKMGIVLADTFFWLIIGMPLAALFYHIVMEVPASNTYITMTKQAVNGVANSLLARLIYIGFALRNRSVLISYREIVYNLLVFFLLCPALVLMGVACRSDFYDSDRHIRTELTRNCQLMHHYLDSWVDNRMTAIVNLSEMAAARKPQQMQPFLEQAKKADVNFLRIGLLNSKATTTAYYPPVDEFGQPNTGKNFADRPYLPMLMKSLQPMMSEVVMGRIGTPRPIVSIIAPVVIRGEYDGYCIGVLGLGQIREHLDKSTFDNKTLYTLIDKNSNVILTNRSDQKVMAHFTRGNGAIKHLDAGISQWVPVAPPNTPNSNRWKDSFYVAETAFGDLSEWTLILEQPVAPFQKTLFDKFTVKLTLLFLILLGTLALAEWLSRRSVVILDKLRMITNDLPHRLESGNNAIVWPNSGLMEEQHILVNFQEMAESLTEKFHETKLLNDSLEIRVAERTKELLEREEKYRAMVEAFDGYMYICSKDFRIEYMNDKLIRRTGRDATGEYCYKALHDRDNICEWCVNEQIYSGLSASWEVKSPKDDRWYAINNSPVYNANGTISKQAMITDITERVKAVEGLAALVQEVKARNRFVESIISNLQSGVIVVALDLRITMVNSYVAEFCGVTPDQLKGKSLNNISQVFHDAIISGKAAAELPVLLNNNEVIIGYTCVDLINVDGIRTGYIITFKDLTEIVRIQKELRQKERLSAIGEVVAKVAHEMRNPLFGLTAAAQILEMELLLEPNQQDLMDSLLKESRRLNNLVEELLDTTREIRVSRKSVNLMCILADSVLAVESMFIEKGVSLHNYGKGELWIFADGDKLAQVIINLVINALDASSVGGYVHMDVVIEEDSVSIIVTDNGEGIPTANLEQIFEVFYTTKKNGTGMGLSICKNIVEAHGGTLSATNNSDGGAKFTVQFPLGDNAL